ncbi:matrix metalloproteinase-18-like [Sceloporus undulatus]|uniref:matrix metalloproteinase-18-like n=1 Tax=Sceloporus undulatus TaxID=8520 RepID=UPI001C4AD876|nr:matrix metalloproteinase-18-like [Sceloporus undulatus]
MKCLLLMIALYGAFSSAVPLVQETDYISETDLEFAKKYMENYYPESESTPVLRSKSATAAEKMQKIQQMQKFFGLKVTGKLDPSTLEAMKKPRCGVPDIEEYRTFPMSPKWGKKDLTYSIQNYTPDMAPADVDNAIERAWKMWSDVTPLTFTRVYDSSADIEISFASGYHGDYIPFDGQGGQLAHAYSPAYGGNAHFDEDENWTKSSPGINLFIVAAHEFGHSLGLQHSSVLEALMFPTYQAGDPQNIRLHRDDIEGIQHLYGPPKEDNDESEDPILVNDAMLADSCDPHLAFDAVVSLRGETIFFKNRFFWRKNPLRTQVEKDPISAFWPTLNHDIDAAYEDEDDDTVFLFKGHKYWATKGNIIQPGFPKNIHSLGLPKIVKKVDAAFYDRSSKKTYFFSGSNYWRYDKAKNALEKDYPRKITADFYEVGSAVDAAFLYNGHIYLFHGSKQYEYDSRTKQFLGIKNSNSWFGCQ